MQILSLIAGIACLVLALLDAFQTVILPRRATGRFRITGVFYIFTWAPWSGFANKIKNERKRETMLSFYGPLSLVLLIVVWASALVLGFALIYYGFGSPFADPLGRTVGLRSDIYVSGTTLFTLGLGDVVPRQYLIRDFVILEAGMGLGFVAMVIGYFPVLYAAFSRREVSIALLDARAGSPPTAVELLHRHAFDGGNAALVVLLEEWERWSAELLESHISYPLLCYFRSQHTHQSWIGALTAILDTCALLISGVQERPARQAQLTFAMARHALVDLAQVFSLEPVKDMPDRLTEKQFGQVYDQMCQSGVRLCRDAHSSVRLRQMRQLYEGYAEALSRYLCMDLPPWVSEHPHKDNWLSVAKLRADAEAGTLDESAAENARALLFDEEHHHF
ncbi:two pore domain potassium channel family protein [Alloacidobacterium dinghuense]|uniref:Two pore domain potassium channel family protein n=1 Tax=Alloacidobacterium dinghuense TaxID=2763107 RepID=A0A7G8BL64_9BACT|nr:potassium channel family protein [Alloacidobacterium dinghuense]QNI33284.1 two pore domain potassium channel family protein [Alloacidobacterium dinghuense]